LCEASAVSQVAAHGKNEDRNCQYLGHVQRTAPYRRGRSKYQVSGHVSGEEFAQCEEAGQVNHSRYDAKQWRQEFLQPRELHIGVYRAACGGKHVSAFRRQSLADDDLSALRWARAPQAPRRLCASRSGSSVPPALTRMARANLEFLAELKALALDEMAANPCR